MKRAFLVLLLGLGSTGCGAKVFHTGAVHTDDVDIADAEIAAAFAAVPQLPQTVRLAVYGTDPERATSVAEALAEVDGVQSTLALSPFLVDGEDRFTDAWPQRSEMSMQKLRLLAARAHCDGLVLVDHATKRETRANGLAALNVLLLPALVTPFLDIETTSYLDAYLYDVRNGYFYGSVSNQVADRRRFSTVYAAEGGTTVDAQWERLQDDLTEAFPELLAP